MQAVAFIFLVACTVQVFAAYVSPVVNVAPAGNLRVVPAGAAAAPRAQPAPNQFNNPITITVTQTTTVDRSVVTTDTAYNSVPVTITDLLVWTSTLPRRVVVQTPVDDHVAVQTRLVERPTTLTVTDAVSNIKVVTDVLVEHYTITHTCYKIMQSTYTRRAVQTLTFSSLLVRTNIKTDVQTRTDYRTVYNTVFVQGYH
ncbi:uncharacterized protein LOC122253560 [Penaeus japonicus]|uniref:uncharacterized protein LOC122253560 n=1 Tax=Penaeus japonicus TaxID=27405 RepID=UPI001C70C052|nr:uncharacterized protein LOC122253560 [Penaeus japonicus]